MKTILILISALVLQTSAAQATQYVVHVNHIQTLQPEHAVLNSLLQKDISIDTTEKTVTVKLSPLCSEARGCSEILQTYHLDLQKMGTVIQASGHLPLQMGIVKQGLSQATITMQKNADNATVIQIQDSNGTSTLIASPITKSSLLF